MRGICSLVLAAASALVPVLQQVRADDGAARASRVWSGPDVSVLGAPSRDGRWLSIVDRSSGDLAIRDLSTGRVKRLTDKQRDDRGVGFAYFSALSRDGSQAAYAWFNEEGFYELRLTDVPEEGETLSKPTTLYRNPEAGFVQPCSFSPDGKQVLTLFFRKDNTSQIALVSTEDGSVTTLRSLNWIYPKRMEFSPDGRYVAYDNLSAVGAEERDIFLLAVDGARETRVLSGEANDLSPVWSAKGDELLFSSDRGGAPEVWAVSVKNGEAVGAPRLVRNDMGRFLPLGVTVDGDLIYGARAGAPQLRIASPRKLNEAQPLWPGATEDRFAPAFSPDGTVVAYLARVSSENYGEQHRAVYLRQWPGGEELEAPDRMSHVERVSWSPSGGRLLLQGSDRRGRTGLFVFDLAKGRTAAAVVGVSTGPEGLAGAFGRSDGTLLYARGGSEAEVVERDLETRDERVIYQAAGTGVITQLAVSADGSQAAFVQASRKPAVWSLDLASGAATKLLELPSGEITDVLWGRGKAELLVGTSSRSGAKLWRVSATGDELRVVPSPSDRLPGMSFHPSDGRLAFASGEVGEEVWVLEHATEGLH